MIAQDGSQKGVKVNTNTGVVRFAIVSDLHSYSEADLTRSQPTREPPSYLCADASATTTLQSNPLDDLIALVNTKKITADVLLCAGDMGNQGSKTGLEYAWKRLGDIAAALGAPHTLGTPGNHDIYVPGPDRAEVLRNLTPWFPVNAKPKRDAFWGDHYVDVDSDAWRVISLNSVAHVSSLPEADHGLITGATIRSLRSTLANLPPKPVQILLCHHHPHQHSEYQLGERDVMKQGQQLLDLLSHHGNWLVVHGHKHHPKLTHAAGGSMAPWVFAAGSLAAFPFHATQGHARNQFYIVEFDIQSLALLGWGGVIYAWDWAPGDGWQPASHSSGLPARSGFGYLGDLGLLVSHMPLIPDREKGYVLWAQLVKAYPHLTRLCPRDIDDLQHYGLEIEFDRDGLPKQVARRS